MNTVRILIFHCDPQVTANFAKLLKDVQRAIGANTRLQIVQTTDENEALRQICDTGLIISEMDEKGLGKRLVKEASVSDIPLILTSPRFCAQDREFERPDVRMLDMDTFSVNLFYEAAINLLAYLMGRRHGLGVSTPLVTCT